MNRLMPSLALMLALAPIRARAVEPSDAPATDETATDEPSTPPRVLVLPVEIEGELPPDTAAEVRALVAEALGDEGVEVVSTGDEPCTDAPCRREAAAGAEATWVVGTEVVGNEDEFTVVVTVFDGASGERLAPFENACSICGLVEVRDMVRLEAIDARAEIVRRESLRVPTMRPEVQPGPITSTAPPPPRSKLVPAGWALVGAGAAATVGGAVLLGLHHRSGGCLDNPRGGECVPVRFTTAPAGGAVLGAGVLVLTGGIVMVVLGRRAERKTPPRVSATPGGLSLRF